MVRGRAGQRIRARRPVRVRPPRLRDSRRTDGRRGAGADARAAAAWPPDADRGDLPDGRDHAGTRGGHPGRRPRPDPERRVLASGGVRVARRHRRPGRALGLLAPAVDGRRRHPRRLPVPRRRDPRFRRHPGRRDPRNRCRRSRHLEGVQAEHGRFRPDRGPSPGHRGGQDASGRTSGHRRRRATSHGGRHSIGPARGSRAAVPARARHLGARDPRHPRRGAADPGRAGWRRGGCRG